MLTIFETSSVTVHHIFIPLVFMYNLQCQFYIVLHFQANTAYSCSNSG